MVQKLDIRKMFSSEEINKILEDAKNIYRKQIRFLKIDNGCDLSNKIEFEYCLFELFKEHFDIFLNCSTQARPKFDPDSTQIRPGVGCLPDIF